MGEVKTSTLLINKKKIEDKFDTVLTNDSRSRNILNETLATGEIMFAGIPIITYIVTDSLFPTSRYKYMGASSRNGTPSARGAFFV